MTDSFLVQVHYHLTGHYQPVCSTDSEPTMISLRQSCGSTSAARRSVKRDSREAVAGRLGRLGGLNSDKSREKGGIPDG